MPIKIKRFWGGMVAVLALCGLMASCSEDDNTYDPYANWEARNAEYFLRGKTTASGVCINRSPNRLHGRPE